jgi:hypothetical protein
MQYDIEARKNLTEGIFIPKDPEEEVAILERAYELSIQTSDIYKKIRHAIDEGEIEKDRPKHLMDEALEAGVITESEHSLLKEEGEWREKAIAVDSYTLEELPVNIKAVQKTPKDAKKSKK